MSRALRPPAEQQRRVGAANNFVSGLILLLERPVEVHDWVQVGPLVGQVRKIGLRASTIRSWQGADIIIPNSKLITEDPGDLEGSARARTQSRSR